MLAQPSITALLKGVCLFHWLFSLLSGMLNHIFNLFIIHSFLPFVYQIPKIYENLSFIHLLLLSLLAGLVFLIAHLTNLIISSDTIVCTFEHSHFLCFFSQLRCMIFLWGILMLILLCWHYICHPTFLPICWFLLYTPRSFFLFHFMVHTAIATELSYTMMGSIILEGGFTQPTEFSGPFKVFLKWQN